MQRLDDALESEPADLDAIADGRRPSRNLGCGDGGGWRGLRLLGTRRPQALSDRFDGRPCFGAGGAGFAGRDHQPRRGAALGVGRHRVGARLQGRDHGVNLPPGIAQASVDALVEAAAERLLAVAQLVLPRLHLRRFLFERRPLARREPALVLERLDVALDFRQVLGQLRLADAAVLPRGVDDRTGEAQPRGNLERQAAARRTIVQAVGRRERGRIEAEPGGCHALGRHRVRLQRVVVGRRHHHGTTDAEVVDHRHGQRAALVRIGPAAGLVEQHERRQRQRAVHGDDVGDVAREGAEARRDRLLVADVGKHRSKDRHLAAVGRRHEQARLGQERQEPGRFECDGLAAGIRPRHHQHAHRGDDEDVDRDRGLGFRRRRRSFVSPVAQMPPHGGDEQRMPRGAQLEPAVARQCRLDPVDEEREARPRLQHVELGRRIDRAVQVPGSPPQGIGERQQDPPHFLEFLLLERDDVVVDLDRAERFEEQAGAAARAAVDDAGNGRPVLAADDEDVAAVAIGDDLLLQVLRRVPAAQVRFQRAAQARPLLAQAIAQVRELRAGIVDDFAGGSDLAPDVADLVLERGRGLGDGGEQGKAAARFPDRGTRGIDRGEKSRQIEERLRFEHASLDGERHQERVEIVGGLERDVAVAQEARRLGRGRERARHRARVDERLQLRQTRRTRRRQCEAAYRFDDPVVFERPQGTGVHETLEILVSVRLDRAIAEYSSARAGLRAQGSGLKQTFETSFDGFA